ncbi:hypothetical protein D3C77_598170 [compost metagenome]
MTCHGKAGQDARQRPGEVRLRIADQLIGIRPVLVLVAVAGNDQVIGEGPYYSLDVGNQWLALPGQQAFVLAAHALAATTGQEKNGAGGSGGGHRSGSWQCQPVTFPRTPPPVQISARRPPLAVVVPVPGACRSGA